MKTRNKFAGVGFFTAISASLCCITPVLAMIAGTSGIASSFSWIEPFRPYLMAITFIVLIVAWTQKLKPPKKINCDCEFEEKSSFFQSKRFLFLVSIFAIIMMAFPYYATIFYPKNDINPSQISKSQISTVVFSVEGMTCSSCEEHIKFEVKKLKGIFDVEASYVDKNVIVKFDSTKINSQNIKESINKTGYKSSLKK